MKNKELTSTDIKEYVLENPEFNAKEMAKRLSKLSKSDVSIDRIAAAKMAITKEQKKFDKLKFKRIKEQDYDEPTILERKDGSTEIIIPKAYYYLMLRMKSNRATDE